MAKRILGLVPARGGSKGIPRKNIAPLLGKPLLAYTAEAAVASRLLARTILSTDDDEIARVGRQYGLEAPFLRPPELARDSTPSIQVIQHAVRTLAEAGETYDAVCLMQPTAPLRTAKMIDQACALFDRTDADSVISVFEIPHHFNPCWALLLNADGSMHWACGLDGPPARRQDLPTAYCRDGSIYITRTAVLMEQNSLFGRKMVPYVVPPERVLNIDTPEDLVKAAEALARRGGTDKP